MKNVDPVRVSNKRRRAESSTSRRRGPSLSSSSSNSSDDLHDLSMSSSDENAAKKGDSSGSSSSSEPSSCRNKKSSLPVHDPYNISRGLGLVRREPWSSIEQGKKNTGKRKDTEKRKQNPKPRVEKERSRTRRSRSDSVARSHNHDHRTSSSPISRRRKGAAQESHVLVGTDEIARQSKRQRYINSAGLESASTARSSRSKILTHRVYNKHLPFSSRPAIERRRDDATRQVVHLERPPQSHGVVANERHQQSRHYLAQEKQDELVLVRASEHRPRSLEEREPRYGSASSGSRFAESCEISCTQRDERHCPPRRYQPTSSDEGSPRKHRRKKTRGIVLVPAPLSQRRRATSERVHLEKRRPRGENAADGTSDEALASGPQSHFRQLIRPPQQKEREAKPTVGIVLKPRKDLIKKPSTGGKNNIADRDVRQRKKGGAISVSARTRGKSSTSKPRNRQTQKSEVEEGRKSEEAAASTVSYTAPSTRKAALASSSSIENPDRRNVKIPFPPKIKHEQVQLQVEDGDIAGCNQINKKVNKGAPPAPAPPSEKIHSSSTGEDVSPITPVDRTSEKYLAFLPNKNLNRAIPRNAEDHSVNTSSKSGDPKKCGGNHKKAVAPVQGERRAADHDSPKAASDKRKHTLSDSQNNASTFKSMEIQQGPGSSGKQIISDLKVEGASATTSSSSRVRLVPPAPSAAEVQQDSTNNAGEPEATEAKLSPGTSLIGAKLTTSGSVEDDQKK
ncbi:unnamed protein product [Amoebophrya sp. A25]|nr:unnamed protein product [Amoebophrya sp. A25]|eukprot:GSA25T00019986001.1